MDINTTEPYPPPNVPLNQGDQSLPPAENKVVESPTTHKKQLIFWSVSIFIVLAIILIAGYANSSYLETRWTNNNGNSLSISGVSPTPVTSSTLAIPETTPLIPATPFQTLLTQHCTSSGDYGDHHQFDPALLPLSLPSTISSNLNTSWCRYPLGGKDSPYSQNKGYLELSAKDSPTLLLIGDAQSAQEEAFFTWPLQLDQVLTQYENSIGTLPVNQDITVAVQMIAKGHPCNGTDKSLYLRVAAHRQLNEYFVVAFREQHFTDTSNIEALLQKYATLHSGDASDKTCEVGQRYNFNDFEKEKAFSTEIFNKFFSGYPVIVEPYKSMVDDVVAEVTNVSVKE